MTGSDLFSDLRDTPLEDIQDRYGHLLREIQRLERERKEIYVGKKLRSEVICFAVNKLATAPVIQEIADKEMLERALEEKRAFDRLLAERDELTKRMGVPRYRLVNTLKEFYSRLTQQAHHSDSPNLASEMEMFSRFFEIQAMLNVYNEHRSLLAELESARKILLESVKAINREDRKFSQHLTANSAQSRPLRREAGRLRAYLEKTKQKPDPLPEEVEEFSLRLMAGESLSMEEFSTMLSHGGLTELEEKEPSPKPSMQRKKKSSQRRVKPMPGRKRDSSKK